ncbi:MAG: hypothetical protein R3B91_11150 [Planctomycetaceae bacterium]
MPLELHVLNHPDRCRCLLSKGLYINAGLEPGKEATGDGNYWCENANDLRSRSQSLRRRVLSRSLSYLL